MALITWCLYIPALCRHLCEIHESGSEIMLEESFNPELLLPEVEYKLKINRNEKNLLIFFFALSIQGLYMVFRFFEIKKTVFSDLKTLYKVNQIDLVKQKLYKICEQLSLSIQKMISTNLEMIFIDLKKSKILNTDIK